MSAPPPGEAGLAALVAQVRPADPEAAQQARRRLDALAKPPGSLGRVEDVAVGLAAIAGTCPPPVPQRPAVVVAAADHGVHLQGVTPWPQAITATMVAVMAEGRAAVNQLAGVVGAEVAVLDVGVAADVPDHPGVHRARVRRGTADLTAGPAMSRDEALRALLAGAALGDELVADGVDLLVTGDMGIANTTPSACLVAALTGADPGTVTGRGTGIDDAALARKRAVVAGALERHRPDPADPVGVLAAVGGLEHAALVGLMLATAAARVPVVLDGLITDAAALVAAALCPPVVGYLVAGHRSVEPGATAALGHLGLAPLLDLDLGLGEGTGGLLAVPIVRAAAAALAGMATLDDLGAG
jgi:nicotinate-nucleotide--dimethylbenzimidazole phosphoribosyltransferase